MGGHYFIRDSEVFFDMAASVDKNFLVIEGASHGGNAMPLFLFVDADRASRN
jgi:hypothetical protein